MRVQAAGREVSATDLCFPSRALEQDEVIKAGCQYISTISLLCKLHAQMLLLLHQASLIYIHNTSIAAHLLLLVINQFFLFFFSLPSSSVGLNRGEKKLTSVILLRLHRSEITVVKPKYTLNIWGNNIKSSALLQSVVILRK